MYMIYFVFFMWICCFSMCFLNLPFCEWLWATQSYACTSLCENLPRHKSRPEIKVAHEWNNVIKWAAHNTCWSKFPTSSNILFSWWKKNSYTWSGLPMIYIKSRHKSITWEAKTMKGNKLIRRHTVTNYLLSIFWCFSTL